MYADDILAKILLGIETKLEEGGNINIPHFNFDLPSPQVGNFIGILIFTQQGRNKECRATIES